jgi:hypothetical protein
MSLPVKVCPLLLKKNLKRKRKIIEMKKKIDLISKKTLGIMLFTAMPFFVVAQKPNWQNLDLKADSTFGISTEKAYTELLKGKKAKPVIVGILDSGVDYDHEDLKTVLWSNAKEIAGNGKDDDKNGYIDDIRGWNFLGSAKGSIEHETLELTRILRRDEAKFGQADETSIPAADLPAFQNYKKMRAAYEEELAEAKSGLINMQSMLWLKKLVKKNLHLPILRALPLETKWRQGLKV